MCGILAILEIKNSNFKHTGSPFQSFRHKAIKLGQRLRHRGPDWSGVYAEGSTVIVHERLAIVDVVSGAQPLLTKDRSVVLAVNGEIYNHVALRKSLFSPDVSFVSNSDCAVILHMLEQYGFDAIENLLNSLVGMFAFVAYDSRNNRYVAARDPYGIVPLYIGWGKDGSVWFSSEMKGLSDQCTNFEVFPPGSYYDSSLPKNEKIKLYYLPKWCEPEYLPSEDLNLEILREGLVKSVERHLMSDVPYGVLLSGGLDSSLIASIATRIARLRSEHVHVEDSVYSHQINLLRIPSFSVGLPGSPDLISAKKVADFLGTTHHEFTFSIQDGLDALSNVIYHLETYDVTTVRASTPMYLMARLIKATGVKMVLSGEGADEIFGGYLYFHKAPNAEEFHKECVRKIQKLHLYDCLRANKAMSSFGVEARVPFLDRQFIEIAMNLDAKHKMTKHEVTQAPRCEKHCLRSAFDTPADPFLPDDILWRQKEQFSDGVGYGWIDALKEFAEEHVSDAQMDTAENRFPFNPPHNKEAYLYRQVFEGHYPQHAAIQTVPSGPSVACSTAAALEWDHSFKNMNEPSGRAMSGIHSCAYLASSVRSA